VPKQLQRPVGPVQQLHILVPASLKLQILERLEKTGESLNSWALHALHQQLHHGDTRPQHKTAPDVAEVLSAYARGDRALGPCGKPWPCEGDEQREQIGGFFYCEHCHLRMS
jgi:hypothetical protein